MHARRRVAVLISALLVGACARKHDAPPPESMPPASASTQPPAQAAGPAPASNGTQGVNLPGGAAVDISFVPDPPVSGQPFTVRLTTSEDETAHRVLTTRVRIGLSAEVADAVEWMDMRKADERGASPGSPAAFLYLAELTAPNAPGFVHVFVQYGDEKPFSQAIAFKLNVDARAAPIAPAKVIAPGPATDAEIGALIDRIDASNGSDRAAATELKRRLRHEQVALVIDRWRPGYPSPGDVLLDALAQVVGEDDKAFIVGKYPEKVGLIRFIRKFHWERDVKQTLVDQLGTSSRYLPPECVEALAELADPSTHPALKSYLVNGWNRHITYKAIAKLPGMDLKRELPKAWEAAMSSSNRTEAAYLIGSVLDLGYLPALEMVMNELREPSGIPSTIFDPALLSSRYLDFSGTAQERLRFWDEHRKELRYDATLKKFTLAK